ncbi:MAG: ABC transporter ATP-binding protein [Pseudomonadota bacterium]
MAELRQSAPPPNDIAIDVSGLSKSFGGRTVVENLSMQVRRGSIYGFLGPNGSGKTTTIRMLCGLLTPDRGEGTCLGYDIRRDANKIKLRVGYMTQRFSLYQDLSVRENLEFVARLYGMRSPRTAARDMIRRLGLDGREEQLAGELSGGWKQRLALGACTLPGPDLLLLDEPTAGVDPKARREFWNEIHALAGEGLTVLVSTHYMDEAERCHEIAYIAYGKLLAHGTVEEVIARSALTTYTVTGDDLNGLSGELAGKAGVDMVAPFGTSLHVSGRDAAALEASIAPYRAREGLSWQKAAPSLEDVFIELMGRSKDNFR